MRFCVLSSGLWRLREQYCINSNVADHRMDAARPPVVQAERDESNDAWFVCEGCKNDERAREDDEWYVTHIRVDPSGVLSGKDDRAYGGDTG